MGEVSDFSIFLSAVIDEKSFDRISNYIDAAKADPSCTILAGGNCDKSKGNCCYEIKLCVPHFSEYVIEKYVIHCKLHH